MTTGTRTFDCPWCGAISPVPADHLGEHFACPECAKGTKLTEKNTSTRKPTDTPPDAPHLSGDRTFDCPWCGAISSVPSSHLGERFACEECGKETKLTSTNTRRAAITAPPPDAPPAEVSAGPNAGILVGAALLVLVGGGAWWFLGRPGDPKPASPSTESAAKPEAPTPAAAPTPAPGPDAPAPATAPPVGPSPSGPPAAPAGPPPPVAADEATELARRDAAMQLAARDAEFALARAELDTWGKANPGALEAAETVPGFAEAVAAIDARRADPAAFPDPARRTPEQVRAADATLRAYLEGSAARTKAAAAVFAALASDRGGRDVAGLADWRGLSPAGDTFRRALGALFASHQALAATVPAELAAKVAAAAKARDDAQRALQAIPPGGPPPPK